MPYAPRAAKVFDRCRGRRKFQRRPRHGHEIALEERLVSHEKDRPRPVNAVRRDRSPGALQELLRRKDAAAADLRGDLRSLLRPLVGAGAYGQPVPFQKMPEHDRGLSRRPSSLIREPPVLIGDLIRFRLGKAVPHKYDVHDPPLFPRQILSPAIGTNSSSSPSRAAYFTLAASPTVV